ncbi:uncharacterized protein LOC105030081 [Esox lucius]|uniref:AIG1-type G domain-containing protein n=1 Tax=Esox lucius TaxID=8010 RepID=A0A3P8XX47_ESOLU|nr:uncharacterized protein LOC105030081 [Esox lucius]XP_010902043.4 uncharacterized protein LOC105030081 [Esox lucius]XP_010902044.4 uncharacterized protein LOC105030081 [Esox lucius]XP_019905137.3 uncharacterized protein LOC105030081 [Esox lucius]
MEFKDTSSKVKNMIPQSHLINRGPPARYQLETKKMSLDNNDKLRRCTFLEKDPFMMNKTILLVGETSTGKSTLINAMVNYVLGVKMEDKVWFEITEEETTGQTESKTTRVTVYEIFGYEGRRVPYSLTIIDTPGFGDTRGIEKDNMIAEKLFQLFRSDKGIHQIDAVGLVIKAAMNRLSDRQQYIFDAVLSLFGKDMEKNIVAFITHSDGMAPKNALEAITAAKVPCAKNEKNHPVHFVFNNVQSEPNDEKYDHYQEQAWNQGLKSMEKLFTYLNNIETKTVKKTEGVLRERKQLEAVVGNLQELIKEIEVKQKEIKDTQNALEKHKNEMEENKNFSYEVEEIYKDKISVDTLRNWFLYNNGATICTVCEENCHYPDCWWVSDLSWCSVMKNNHCTVCTNKCHFTKHVKGNEKYDLKTRMVTRTYEELKYKYDISEKGVGEKENVLIRLQKELEELTNKKTSLVEESYQCLIILEEIALKAISLSTAKHLDFLIKRMTETGDMEKVKKLEELSRNTRKGI